MTTNKKNIPEEMQILEGEQEFYISLGQRLRKFREMNEISSAQMAEIAGTTADQWEKYETAELAFPLYHLVPVLEHYGFPPELKLWQFN